MTGIVWTDATLVRITADYDAVTLFITEANAESREVRCEGYVSFGLSGFWDEVIIERADVLAEHPAIDAAWASITQRLGAQPQDSGNIARNQRRWSCLLIRFGDGCELTVVASSFSVI
jgi:hypothetical protein